MSGRETKSGLAVAKVRVPFGVIAIIYEARPNVTADAAGLCLKTGNAVILRGGSEAFRSNKMIAAILSDAVGRVGLPPEAIQFVETTDRQAVDILLRLRREIDLVIPRGGAGLIQKVVETSLVPVIETGVGVCHTFVDESADLGMAADIAFNAKVSRPSVCNAMETLLIHEKIAALFAPLALERLEKAGVAFYGCEQVCRLWPSAQPADAQNWAVEYGDLRLSVKIVADMDEALAHIARYGSKHSEAIVTRDFINARRFQKEVDAAAVYVNASTRFTDGFEFGFGAEIGISTQKLHARGPMGLQELTSYKYIISGNGQIRG
jgi:glutamate-5-semialdehyde dehydrogenase